MPSTIRSRITLSPMRIRLTPPLPVSGSPRRSHDAADIVGIQSDQRSTSISRSYISAGFALDSCSTRHVRDPVMLRNLQALREHVLAVRAAIELVVRRMRGTVGNGFVSSTSHTSAGASRPGDRQVRSRHRTNCVSVADGQVKAAEGRLLGEDVNHDIAQGFLDSSDKSHAWPGPVVCKMKGENP